MSLNFGIQFPFNCELNSLLGAWSTWSRVCRESSQFLSVRMAAWRCCIPALQPGWLHVLLQVPVILLFPVHSRAGRAVPAWSVGRAAGMGLADPGLLRAWLPLPAPTPTRDFHLFCFPQMSWHLLVLCLGARVHPELSAGNTCYYF